MDAKQKLEEVAEQRKILEKGGGAEAVDRQHRLGKLTAWERMELLFDPGTFKELNLWAKPFKTGFDIDETNLPRDAVLIGWGEVHGRPAIAYAHDFTTLAGTFGSTLRAKVSKAMLRAVEEGIPMVGIVDSGGERIHDMFGRPGWRHLTRGTAIGGGGQPYYAPHLGSGVIPQISLLLGPCYAGSAYSPMQVDWYIMRKGVSLMSVASPDLLKSVTFVDVTREEIGGALLHATTSGCCDILTNSDEEAMAKCRELLSFFPSNWKEKPPLVNTKDNPDRRDEDLLDLTYSNAARNYDVHEVISRVVDAGNFCEVQSLYAPNIVAGFARLDGQSIGIVANNPAIAQGSLDANACDKATRLIRFCDCFSIPIIFLVDTPGFLPSREQEQSKDGLERHAAKPIFAICESTVPKITIYLGKCYGAGRLVMGTEAMGVDAVYAWPAAELRVIGLDDAAKAIYQKELTAANSEELIRAKAKELDQRFAEPYHSAATLSIEDIIDPRDTRPTLIRTLNRLSRKMELEPPRPRRKHSLIPV